MDQEAMIKAALESGKDGFKVGHAFVRLDGGDMHIICTSCGAEELVHGYSNGKHPQKFEYEPTRLDGTEYVKCNSCKLVHERVVPFAR